MAEVSCVTAADHTDQGVSIIIPIPGRRDSDLLKHTPMYYFCPLTIYASPKVADCQDNLVDAWPGGGTAARAPKWCRQMST